ncbi:MAG: cell division protein FtsZ [Deltaproteobacteria bacterium]|nr:MAG: cell division protein FtsZ [Deltaproteobacteria bacterium]
MPFRMPDSKTVTVIKVIGVGGAGGNAINRMVDNQLQGVDFIAANTDKQALDQSRADLCLHLGPEETKGLGAGADPEVGLMAAKESRAVIEQALQGSHMVFIAAGLGGGTGTGAAPVVAEISKSLGALTVAVVTKPFAAEGKARANNAQAGWQELRKHVDTIITIPNDRLLVCMDKNDKFEDMLAKVDNVLLEAVKGITDLINVPGLINADFADLKTIMKEVGPAVMGSGLASGEGRASEAAKMAVDNELLEECGVDGARGLIINISASKETLTMAEFIETSTCIQQKVDESAKIVIGASYDDDLGDKLRVTVVATGVGNVQKKNTINPLEGRGQKAMNQGSHGAEGVSRSVSASPNVRPSLPKLPSSKFENYDVLGSSDVPNGRSLDMYKQNSEMFERPAYLRKKAN